MSTNPPRSNISTGSKLRGDRHNNSGISSQKTNSTSADTNSKIGKITPYKEKLQDKKLAKANDVSIASSPNDTIINVDSEPANNNGKQCPCQQNDKSNTIVCAKCSQQWHTKCCNLSGATPSVIGKMGTWECPRCFKSPYVDDSNLDQFQKFIGKMADLEKCNEELNDSVTSIQFFNQHIRHLLLNDTKYKAQTSKIDSLCSNMEAIKKQIGEIHGVTCSAEDDLVHVYNGVEARMDRLNAKVEEFMSSNNNIELSQAIEKLATIPFEKLERLAAMEDEFSKLSARLPDSQPNQSRSSPGRHSVSSLPNTISPHAKAKPPPCEPYIGYIENGVNDEVKASLHKFVDEKKADFKPVNDSRDVSYFGKYTYKYSGVSHAAADMPQEISDLLDCIRPKLPDPEATINSCLITRYNNGSQHIPPHRDDEPVIDPESHIVTVTLGAERKMTFTDNASTRSEELLLQDGSILVASRFCQDFWLHGIEKDTSENVRYSFTFRNISPHYINSTILIGDSNTKLVNFGEGQGTLGKWMPGKCVKAGYIEAIPAATDIGPYRNIVIHTGINSINNSNYRRSDNYLIQALESKCKNIADVYPRSKLFVSLLLPTRSEALNRHVRKFNNMILDLTYNFKNIFIIDHAIFGDLLCDEHGRWDTENDCANTRDTLHLGKKGIRLFASKIKSSIFERGRSQARSRFSGGGGRYDAAVDRQGPA